jgi:hypothetical protein
MMKKNAMRTLSTGMFLALITILIIPSATSANGFGIISDSAAREDWWDNRWHYRLFITVDAGDQTRRDYPVDLFINFTGWIRSSDVIDYNSLRVLDSGVEIPSQYDPSTNKTGTLIFVVVGLLDAGENKTFTAYFDTVANGLKPVPDYGDPDYVLNYKQLLEEGKLLGSSPENGITDDWWFPSYLSYSTYEYQNWIVGDVKATMSAWGDGWNGTDWIRHYASVVLYRDSFTAYTTVWNNATDCEVAWASGLLNFSTGRPSGSEEASKDHGLHVITDDWMVNDVAAIDYDGVGTVMASATVDTYNMVLERSCIIDGDGSSLEYILTPQTDSALEILSVVGETSGVYSDTTYSLDSYMGMSTVLFTVAPIDENFEVNYTVKSHDFDDTLNVVAKNSSTNYLIMYDEDDPAGVTYSKPQISALIFPEKVAASNMVIEFWENISARAPGPAFFDYYINLTTNAKEWWYNTTLTPSQNHLPQCNEFDFLLHYMNGSSDPEQEVIDLMGSYSNPAGISIVEEDAIPISLKVYTPLDAQVFNAWIELPHNPIATHVRINATASGDTFLGLYYKIGSNGTEIPFNGTVNLSIASLNGAEIDGRVSIFIIARDTNGTIMSELRTIFITKTFVQALFGTYGSLVIIVGSLIGTVIGCMYMAVIKKRKAIRAGANSSFIARKK